MALCCHCPFDISVGVWGFCHRTESDILLFVFEYNKRTTTYVKLTNGNLDQRLFFGSSPKYVIQKFKDELGKDL